MSDLNETASNWANKMSSVLGLSAQPAPEAGVMKTPDDPNVSTILPQSDPEPPPAAGVEVAPEDPKMAAETGQQGEVICAINPESPSDPQGQSPDSAASDDSAPSPPPLMATPCKQLTKDEVEKLVTDINNKIDGAELMMDDDVARQIVGQMSECEIAALPTSVRNKLFDTLKSGFHSDEDSAAMQKLVSVAPEAEGDLDPDMEAKVKDIETRLNNANWFLEDDVAQQIVRELTPEQIQKLPNAIRNRIQAELQEGVYKTKNDERREQDKLYREELRDEAFEQLDRAKRQELIDRLNKDPEIQKARQEWKKWQNDIQKRTAIIERIAKHQEQVYGIENEKGIPPLKFDFENPSAPTTDKDGNWIPAANGTHNYEAGVIWINTHPHATVKFNHFDEAVNVTAHEVSHRYQAILADRLDRGEIKPGDPLYDAAMTFKLNNGNGKGYFVDPDKDYETYEAQPREAHSDETAEDLENANVGE